MEKLALNPIGSLKKSKSTKIPNALKVARVETQSSLLMSSHDIFAMSTSG